MSVASEIEPSRMQEFRQYFGRFHDARPGSIEVVIAIRHDHAPLLDGEEGRLWKIGFRRIVRYRFAAQGGESV